MNYSGGSQDEVRFLKTYEVSLLRKEGECNDVLFLSFAPEDSGRAVVLQPTVQNKVLQSSGL